MIISCNNCGKKFNIDSNLIPKNGRLLQCSSCNHKWFFKKEIEIKPVISSKIKEHVEQLQPLNEPKDSLEIQIPKTIKFFDKEIEDDSIDEKILSNKIDDKDEVKNLNLSFTHNKKRYSILSISIVFIITFIALIIVLDTLKSPISKIVPNIEFMLYNLYETIYDIKLFLIDLI